MKPTPPNPPDSAAPSGAKLWLQAACIFAAAVGFGVIYNGASPLGVRPNAPGAVAAGSAAPDVAPAKPAAPRKGVFNETVLLTLEPAPGSVPPPRGNNPTPAAVLPQPVIPDLTWPQVKALLAARRIVLVDARARTAFDLGHIPGAVLLPSNATVPEVQAFAAQYAKDTAFVVYCGATSCHASRYLAQQLVTVGGFKNVSDMPGGFAEYTLAQTALPPAKP